MIDDLNEKQGTARPMNEASQWRYALARQIAPFIAVNPNVQAIMLAGSTSRGNADRYSDVEIGVFWSRPPSDEERMAPIEPSGGVFWELDEYNDVDEIWMGEWGMFGVKMDVRNLTVEKMERIISDVIQQYDTDPFKHATLSALQHAIPLYNAPLLEGWQQRIIHYPDELARAIVEQYLDLTEWPWWIETLIARDDIPLLYQSFSEAVWQILGMLIGLNHLYHPGNKWMDRLINELAIAPPDLSRRIKAAFRCEPLGGLLKLKMLILEVYALVEQHMPAIDVQTARQRFLRWREPFDEQPW